LRTVSIWAWFVRLDAVLEVRRTAARDVRRAAVGDVRRAAVGDVRRVAVRDVPLDDVPRDPVLDPLRDVVLAMIGHRSSRLIPKNYHGCEQKHSVLLHQIIIFSS
jgi:hypothetical protein